MFKVIQLQFLTAACLADQAVPLHQREDCRRLQGCRRVLATRPHLKLSFSCYSSFLLEAHGIMFREASIIFCRNPICLEVMLKQAVLYKK